jgi:hypothetical protein
MDHRCFLLALEPSEQRILQDAFLVVAPDAIEAELILRKFRAVPTEHSTRLLGEWRKDLIEKRCWIEATRKVISLDTPSAHALSEIVWD